MSGGFNATSSASMSYTFKAKDVNSDENVTTKIVNNKINLTITSDKIFNGDMDLVLKHNDNNISEVESLSWNNETEKNVTFTDVNATSDKTIVYIKWKNNITSGEQNNTDDKFAIIPNNYNCNVINAKSNAPFELDVITDDYNSSSFNSDENITSILNGKEYNISKVKDGISVSDLFLKEGNYTLEVNDSKFSLIDVNDTKKEDRTIYCKFTFEVKKSNYTKYEAGSGKFKGAKIKIDNKYYPLKIYR